MPRCSAFLICLSCRLCPIRPYGAPSPRGEGFIRRYAFSTYACIRFDVMEEAVFSYRSLPHWGRGTAPAVDRVLSYNACLRRIFHLFQLSFMPLEPYPARYASHLPHAGKAGDTRETCHTQTFGHRSIYICGEAATTTLNPEPRTLKSLVKQNPLTRAFFSCIIASVVVMNYVY